MAQETLELEEEYCAENQNILTKRIVGYVLNKNKKYKDINLLGFSLYDIVRSAIDINDDAQFYCLHNAEMYAKDIIYKTEERDFKKALKSLKEMFKDFKIINNGEAYSCSTKFIMPFNTK
ncbi:MAG: hypothetical protein EOM50_22965 [Erysipelotrichia bacterium]|nr:hypothetical protein [Erysipelotrichia bacterium]